MHAKVLSKHLIAWTKVYHDNVSPFPCPTTEQGAVEIEPKQSTATFNLPPCLAMLHTEILPPFPCFIHTLRLASLLP
jgi:hypothetical protein